MMAAWAWDLAEKVSKILDLATQVLGMIADKPCGEYGAFRSDNLELRAISAAWNQHSASQILNRRQSDENIIVHRSILH